MLMAVYRRVQLTDAHTVTIGDINDITGEINIKCAWKFGVKDLTADIELSIPSGEEFDVNNLNISAKMFNYGVIRCHSNTVLKAGGKLKLCAGSIFRFVR